MPGQKIREANQGPSDSYPAQQFPIHDGSEWKGQVVYDGPLHISGLKKDSIKNQPRHMVKSMSAIIVRYTLDRGHFHLTGPSRTQAREYPQTMRAATTCNPTKAKAFQSLLDMDQSLTLGYRLDKLHIASRVLRECGTSGGTPAAASPLPSSCPAG